MSTIGYAAIEVIPVFPGITEKLAAGVTAPAGTAGTKAGTNFGSKFGTSAVKAGRAGADKIATGAVAPAGVAGTKAGSSFGGKFKTSATTTGRGSADGIFADAQRGAAAAGLGLGKRFALSAKASIAQYGKQVGATVAGYFAYQKVSQFLKESVAEGKEAIAVQKLTEAAIASTGGAAGVTAEHMSDLAGEQSKLIGVDDELIQTGANLLLRFANVRNGIGKTNDVFDQTVVAGENVSAALGTALPSAMRLVGRAVNDPIKGLTALTRAGITFTDQQKEQIAALVDSGDALGAQKLVLSQIEERFGGSAEALNTPLKQLQVGFANVEEAVGLKLIPALNTGAAVLITTAGAVAKVVDVGRGLLDLANSLPGPVKDTALALTAVYVAQKLIASSAVQGSLTRMASGLDTVRLKGMLTADTLRNVNLRSAGVRSGVGLAGIAMATFADDIGGSNKALGALSTVAGDAALGFSVGGPWGAAIGAGVGLLTTLGGAFHSSSVASDEAIDSQQDYASTLNTTNGAITAQTRVLAANALEQDGVLTTAQEYGLRLPQVTNAVLGVGDAHDVVMGKLRALQADLSGANIDWQEYTAQQVAASQAAGGAGDTIRSAAEYQQIYTEARRGDLGAVNKLIAALGGETQKLNADVDAKKRVSAATGELKDKQDQATDSTQQLTLAQQLLNNVFAGRTGSLANLTLQILSASAANKELAGVSVSTSGVINTQTESGAKLAQNLIGIATAASQVTGSQDIQRLAVIRARDAIYDQARAAGVGKEAAHNLASNLLQVPPAADKASGALGRTKGAADNLGKSDPTVTVNADTVKANRDMAAFRENTNRELNAIDDEFVKIGLSAQADKVAAQLGAVGLKDGGDVTRAAARLAVRGPCGPRSDSIPAYLSNGERVNAAHVINKAGRGNNARGQEVFGAFERMVMRGEVGSFGDLQPFKDGGPVYVRPAVAPTGVSSAIASVHNAFDSIDAAVSKALSARVNDRLTHLPTAGQLGPGGNLTPAQLARGQQFATAQVGKPYTWGGVGPGGYDCSGFQSATLNAAVGRYPYSRLGATSSMPWSGSSPGVGKYTMGWTTNWEGSGIGHTSGNIGGLNVESYGGHGPAVGGGARSPMDPHFYGHMHYASGGAVRPYNGLKKFDRGGYLDPGFTLAYNGLGRREEIPHPAGPSNADVASAIRSLEAMLRSTTLQVHATNAREIAGNIGGTVAFVGERFGSTDNRLLGMGEET